MNTIEPDPKGQTDLAAFAKKRAKKLRLFLADLGHGISHSQSLEAMAHAEGFRDWNTYCASFKLVADIVPEHDFKAAKHYENFPVQVGDRISGKYRGVTFKGVLLGLEQTITPGVWRVKMHFDTPVTLDNPKRFAVTRQRVQVTFNAEGRSVNLKGTPDGSTAIDLP
ncbi:MAG: hypothetical protein COB37_02680 [Kordiimonadales bacterium]|nr:MAG: hypothetical protein COB37_02680 [Kordiimonadales bacterium]